MIAILSVLLFVIVVGYIAAALLIYFKVNKKLEPKIGDIIKVKEGFAEIIEYEPILNVATCLCLDNSFAAIQDKIFYAVFNLRQIEYITNRASLKDAEK